MNNEFRVVQSLTRLILAAVLVATPFLAYKSFSANQAASAETKSESPSIGLPAKQKSATLAQSIEQAITASSFADARWGVYILSLRWSRPVLAQR